MFLLIQFIEFLVVSQFQFNNTMANENSKWGAPRIHGELLKLGFNICESTIQRYMPKKGKRTTGRIG